VLLIDDDLGKSGASSQGRAAFRRLVSEVGLDQVGIILGVEMSRLARSSKDWHQLLEICALFGTLIADLDGVYDPAHYNDRLLLGLKGTMSEAELHVIKQRMDRGKLSKGRRGELVLGVPIGYVKPPPPGKSCSIRMNRCTTSLCAGVPQVRGVGDAQCGAQISGRAQRADRRTRARRDRERRASVAPSQPDDAAQYAQEPDLRRSVRVWAPAAGPAQAAAG
jgi:hypothetical protein